MAVQQREAVLIFPFPPTIHYRAAAIAWPSVQSIEWCIARLAPTAGCALHNIASVRLKPCTLWEGSAMVGGTLAGIAF